MIIQIEPKTRQWLGVVILGAIIAGMIYTGLIPESIYQPYIAPIAGAFFYHVIRMLSTPANPTQPKEG